MKYFLIIFALFSTLFATAQTIVNGRVVSTDKTGVSGLSILIHQKNNANRIITYSITDEKGGFRLAFASGEDSLGLSVRSMTNRDTTVCIANRSQVINFVLPPANHEIREVSVNARAITGKKDTITYLVEKFARVKDQSIGDVIKNMPGFEVSPEGQVSYQGKPIQKYYIEGLDLLEGRYGIANKNLPYRDVGSVEVLENHQPIKMLENRVFSNGTSLNLKLKKNVTTTGTMQVGAADPLPAAQPQCHPPHAVLKETANHCLPAVEQHRRRFEYAEPTAAIRRRHPRSNGKTRKGRPGRDPGDHTASGRQEILSEQQCQLVVNQSSGQD